MRLSILDLVPVRRDQSSSDALAASLRLARTAERLGFTRYWVAEHHNLPWVAAASPPVLVALIAAHTSRLRVGSGGVMLPNHVPLVVAEQFALLEAAFPGRIDLGIGRAAGSDPVTSLVLRGGRDLPDTAQLADEFPGSLDDVAALMCPSGVSVQLRDGDYQLKATPAAVSEPYLWLLGSSLYSAELAATKGLPYVFAHHLFGRGAEEALALYRSQFVPSALAVEPTAFMTVNAVVAETRDEAIALMLPELHTLARLETGLPLGPLDLVEDAQAASLTPQQQGIVESGLNRAVVGTPGEAAEQLLALSQRLRVDEVMVNPVASARAGTDSNTAPAREATLELLAAVLC